MTARPSNDTALLTAREDAPATTSWRDILAVHPAADALPLLSPEALQELADDIKQNGLLEPPILWHDVETNKVYLLDGRNRLDAMELADIDFLMPRGDRLEWHLPSMEGRPGLSAHDYVPSMQPLVVESAADHPAVTPSRTDKKQGTLSNTRTYIDPAALVIAANITRRHLPAAERVRLALAIRATTPTRDPVETAPPVGVSLGGRGKTGEASEIAKRIGVSVRTVERVASVINQARQNAAPAYNSEAYKLQREKQAKAEATRKAKREAEQAEREKAEQKRIARLDAQREAVHQRLLTYCQGQIDLGADARLNVLNWLTTQALADGYGEARQRRVEDFLRSAAKDTEPTISGPTTCNPRCTAGPGHTDWCEFAKVTP